MINKKGDIEFSASIIEQGTDNKGHFVVLDNTLFYPDGKGGSIGDRGTIGGLKVLEVLEVGERILHYLPDLPKETLVSCSIDAERREDLSVQHTAQHILSQSFIKVANIETVSFHMGEAISTIDLNSADVSKDILDESEYLANVVVMENRKVDKYFVNREELEKLDLRKKIDIAGPIRIVEIEDFDISMCGGMHVDVTCEIGLIKIVKTEHFKKTLTRVYYVAGNRALFDYRKKAQILNEISLMLTTGEDDLVSKIKRIQDDGSKLVKVNKQLTEKFLAASANEIYANGIGTKGKVLSIVELPEMTVENASILSKLLLNKNNLASLIYAKGERLFVLVTFGENIGINTDALKSDLALATSGRVWGSKNSIFIDCQEEFLSDIEEIFKNTFNRAFTTD
ncbi:MAG: alanyl-tRNA editing protein [Caldisericaceae bacterium]